MSDLIERLEVVLKDYPGRIAPHLLKKTITALREKEASKAETVEYFKGRLEVACDRIKELIGVESDLKARIAELELMFENQLTTVIQYEQARIHLENFDRYRKDSDVNAAIDIFNRIRGSDEI